MPRPYPVLRGKDIIRWSWQWCIGQTLLTSVVSFVPTFLVWAANWGLSEWLASGILPFLWSLGSCLDPSPYRNYISWPEHLVTTSIFTLFLLSGLVIPASRAYNYFTTCYLLYLADVSFSLDCIGEFLLKVFNQMPFALLWTDLLVLLSPLYFHLSGTRMIYPSVLFSILLYPCMFTDSIVDWRD